MILSIVVRGERLSGEAGKEILRPILLTRLLRLNFYVPDIDTSAVQTTVGKIVEALLITSLD
jgi:hypothetical protein